MAENKCAVVFLADGCEECEALLVVDILRRAGINVVTASINGSRSLTSSHSVKIEADEIIENVDFDAADIVVLPGGIPGTYNLKDSETVCKTATEFAEKKMVAAVCAAPSVLASLKLLEGKKATVAPSFEDRMEGAVMTRESVTVDGNIITGQGLGASIPFALKIVEMLLDRETADAVAKKICYRG